MLNVWPLTRLDVPAVSCSRRAGPVRARAVARRGARGPAPRRRTLAREAARRVRARAAVRARLRRALVDVALAAAGISLCRQ